MKNNFSDPGTGYVSGITTEDVKNLKNSNQRLGFFFGLFTGIIVTYMAMKVFAKKK